MQSYIDTQSKLFSRGINFTIQEYLFAVNIVMGEDERVSYALAFDPDGLKKAVDTVNEQEYLESKAGDIPALMNSQHIIKLIDELTESYNSVVQSKALNLEDYKFTGGQIAQILQNLLHYKISDLDTASTKDVISLIKLLAEQFGLEGGDEFEKHFIQVYPPFNALCGKCNREFDVMRGIDCVCPHCGNVYKWSEKEQRFYPKVAKL